MGEFQPKTLIDALEDFDGGVNQTRSPLKLTRNIMARSVNVTVRGDFATHRPPYHKRLLSYENNTTQNLVETGLFQGACFYKPDNADPCLMAAISGMLFQFQIVLNTVTVKRVDGGTTQDPAATQHWLWQAEKWVIWNDGTSNPVFYDGTTATRSNYGAAVQFSGWNTANFFIQAIGATQTIAFDAVGAGNLLVGDVLTLTNRGTFVVQAIAGLNIDLLNVNAIPVGSQIVAHIAPVFFWQHNGTQLPPGRMGAYGMGRNWECLPDGKQFVASDIVGSSSGTQAENYRDAVLNVTENIFLAGGGNFTVPGSVGDIMAMRFVATLDASLGQGALQIVTPTTIFSCNAPVDRTTWQDMTNPILTESLISNGGKGQNSTVLANGDLLFRSIDGIRSLILARRDFDTWGNTPVSFEVDDILSQDDPGLLRYGSAIVFDNRLLMTTHAIQHAQGVYWQGLVPLNFDPVSSLRGKLPSVYDSGIWSGLNVLQLVLGQFNDVERGFAFVLNTTTGATKIELWELMKSGIADNDGANDIPIVWGFTSASLKFGQEDPRARQLLKLQDGEIYIEDLIGTVEFDAGYFPDQYPCRVPWLRWQECQTSDASNSKPGFRPRIGLGEPSGLPCDVSNNRPLREFYTFQFDLMIKGHCVFLGARFKAVTQPQSEFSKPSCAVICPAETPLSQLFVISKIGGVPTLVATANKGSGGTVSDQFGNLYLLTIQVVNGVPTIVPVLI